jgi:phosphoglycolate phosphatase-like HAD superfamily hydrolase
VEYEAIFFDWDGVITDSVDVKTQAYCDMFERYESDIQRKVREHHLKNGGMSRFDKFPFYYREFLGKEINQKQINELASEFSLLVKEKIIQAPFVEGALETITAEYAKGTKLFVVTGTPAEEIIDIAKKKELVQYFEEICGSPAGKPELTAYLIDKYGLNPRECLFIGDAMADYEAARVNGFDFLGVVKTGESVIFPSGTKISCGCYVP